ncbi:hypothetical protein [Nocardia thraciensis]
MAEDAAGSNPANLAVLPFFSGTGSPGLGVQSGEIDSVEDPGFQHPIGPGEQAAGPLSFSAESGSEGAIKRRQKIAPGEPAPTKPGHYWEVPLEPPPGASAALQSFVKMADTAIQAAVNLLGRGVPVPPPPVDDLLKPVVIEALGKGQATEDYKEALAAVEAKQTSLLSFDSQVAQTAVQVASEKDETLRAIRQIVAELQSKLKAAGTGKLKPAQETKLMAQIAVAVESVYKKVEAVYESNQKWAGGNDDKGGSEQGGSQGGGAAGGGGAAPGAGGGGGGIGQLLPMLAMMVPMGIMSLAPLGMQLLQQHQERQEREREKAEQQKAEQALATGAPPADPNAAGVVPAGAPGAPAPAAPATAAPPAASAVPAANTPPPASPAPNGPAVTAAASRMRNTTARPAVTHQETDSDAPESDDPEQPQPQPEDIAVDV